MKNGGGWVKAGLKIKYYLNGYIRMKFKRQKEYATLTFSYVFQHDDDEVYFAYSYPYTFTDM